MIALVAGATRGAGRGNRGPARRGRRDRLLPPAIDAEGRSELDRPETIEETAELVTAAGGTGIAVRVDHLDPDQVEALAERIDASRGGSTCWSTTCGVASRCTTGTRRCGSTTWTTGCACSGWRSTPTSSPATTLLPLLIRRPGGLVVEVTDGTTDYNDTHYRVSLVYDLAKVSVNRLAFSQAHELEPHGGTAVALTPGFLRSEAMLEHFGVTEETWREAAPDPASACRRRPAYVGPRGRRPGHRPGQAALVGQVGLQRRAGPGVRVHRRRRQPAGRVALHDRGPRTPGKEADPADYR